MWGEMKVKKSQEKSRKNNRIKEVFTKEETKIIKIGVIPC
jgi:hypothetical protein